MNAPIPMAPTANFDIGTLYSGSYLKADDLSGQTYSATIVAVERVEIPETDGSIRPKAALTLQGWPAKLLLNKTNFEAIAAVYGRQSGGWLNKPLEVYPDSVLFGGRMVPCIRVRVPRPAAAPAAIPGATVSPAAPMAPPAPATPAASPAAIPGAVPIAPAQTPLLPPLMAPADFSDDIPY